MERSAPRDLNDSFILIRSFRMAIIETGDADTPPCPPNRSFPGVEQSGHPCPILAYLGTDFSVSDASCKHKTTVRWLVICGKGRFDLFAVVVVPLGSYGPCGILTRICRFKVVDLNLNFNFSRSESDQDEAIVPSFEARNRTGKVTVRDRRVYPSRVSKPAE